MGELNNNNYFLDIFEHRISEFTNAPYVVLTDSCTNAIFLSLIYTKPKNITLPTHTYISVYNAVLNADIKLDIKFHEWEHSYNLIGSNIYDCAVGFKQSMYIKNTIQCISFQQKKALPIGKGGAILLDNEEDYYILKRMAFDGRDASISVRDDKNIIRGWHMNMISEQASKGLLLLNQYIHDDKFLLSYKNYPNIYHNNNNIIYA